MIKSINYKKNSFIVIPILIFIISLFLGYPLFSTYDDVLIMDVLSGRLTGSPYPCTSFFSIFLGYIISSLYKIAFLPWFPIFIILTGLVGLTCIFSSIYTMLENKNISTILKIFVFVINILLSIEFVFAPTYTMSSVLIGVSSIYFLNKKKLPLSLFLLMLSTMIRYESGFVICAFWGINYIYLHFVNTKKISLKFVTIGILALVLVLGSFLGDETIKSHIEPNGYSDFMKAMQLNFDYPKTKEFEQNKQKIIKDAGLDETIFELIENTYFSMDKRITTQSLNALNKYSIMKANNFWSELKNNNILKNLKMHFKADTLLMLTMILLSILGIYAFIYSLKRNAIDILYVILVVMLSLILFAYIFIMQRTLLRAICTIFLPCQMALIMHLSETHQNLELKNNFILSIVGIALCVILAILANVTLAIILFSLLSIFLFKDSKIKIISLLVFTLMLVFPSLNVVRSQEYVLNKWMRKYASENRNIIEKYSQEHSNDIIVYSTTNSFDTRMIVPNKPIYNLIPYGGTYVHSSVHNMQLQKIGLKSYDISAFKEKNVYLLDDTLSTSLRDNLTKALELKGIHGYFKPFDVLDEKRNLGLYKYVETFINER